MKFTYFGHAAFSIEMGGYHLLFDPYITLNEKAKDIDIKSIKADYILLSHGHKDHVADVMEIAKNTNATIIAMPEVWNWFKKQGLAKGHALNYGTKVFPFGEVRMVAAWHSSSMPDGSYGGNPAGFIITTEEGSFYYAGDTSLSMEMQLVPRFAVLKFAVLPIGGNYTMNIDDALIASDFIKADRIIGVHFDTFDVIKINLQEAIAKFEGSGKTLILPSIGEVIDLTY